MSVRRRSPHRLRWVCVVVLLTLCVVCGGWTFAWFALHQQSLRLAAYWQGIVEAHPEFGSVRIHASLDMHTLVFVAPVTLSATDRLALERLVASEPPYRRTVTYAQAPSPP